MLAVARPSVAVVCALTCGVASAATLPPDAALFREPAGVRSAGMGGAHRGVGTSNDTLFLNPAGMALFKRYSVELGYGYSPYTNLSDVSISAVDSRSGPVAGGLAYTYTRGDGEGTDAGLHRIIVGAAYALSDYIAIGITGRHVRGAFNDGDKRRNPKLYTGDVGLMLRLAGLGIGVTAQNVIKDDLTRLVPLTFGVGVGYTSGLFTLAADFDINSRNPDHTLERYHVGGEYFIANAFPLRLGYYRAPFTRKDGVAKTENVLTAGTGWVSESGALAISFERSFERERNWGMVTSLQFYL